MPSALAANRSFLQCIHDAEAWTDTTAVESAGFIEVGPFRLRQRGTLLEIRAKLTPADIRIGFMPTCELPGSEDLPTLAGVLTAGGDNGKTEWIHGYTWSTADCEIDGETARLASAVAATLEKVGVTRVDTADRDAELPKATDGRWEIHHDERFLTVYTPLYRDDCAPVDAVL